MTNTATATTNRDATGWLGLLSAAVLLVLSAACNQTPPGAHVDPALITLVPAGTVILADVWYERLAETPLYQNYLADREIPQLDEFAQATGLDLRGDIWEVLFISNGEQSALLGRGEFADEAEPRLVQEAGAARRFGYKGYTFIGDEEQAVMFISPTVAGVGATPLLKAIIDARDQSNGPPAALAERMLEIPGEAPFWMAYAGKGPINLPVEPRADLANVVRVLESIQTGSIYFDLSAGISATSAGLTASEEDARRLHDTLRGLVGIGRLLAPKSQPELEQVFDGIRVTQEGSKVNLYLDAPETVVDALIELGSGLVPPAQAP